MEGLFPDALAPVPAFLLIFASFFTSAITAAAGIGGGLLMLAFMTYVIPLAALIPVHGLVQLGSNTGRSYVQRNHIDWGVTRQFLFGSAFGAVAAVFFVIRSQKPCSKYFLGFSF